jgi:glycogen operon protein
MTDQHWADGNARCMGVLLDGRAQETGIRRIGTDATLLLVLNSYHDVVQFKLPEAVGGKQWVCLVDTNNDETDLTSFAFGHEYQVTGRSLLLLILQPTASRGRHSDAERSFRHVVQAVEEARSSSLAGEDDVASRAGR